MERTTNWDLLKLVFLKDYETLLVEIESYLRKNGYKEIERTKYYVFAKGDLPVLLVSHCDIAKPRKQMTEETDLSYDEDTYILKSSDPKRKYLGADDRAGVYGLLTLAQNTQYKPSLLFTTEEEVMLFKGVNKFIIDHKNDSYLHKELLYAVELDDNNQDTSAYYKTHNASFENFIDTYGFNKQSTFKQFGYFTDIVNLSAHYNLASVNLSVGYYKQHKNDHYLKMNELEATIDKVQKILDDTYHNLNTIKRFYSFKGRKIFKRLALSYKLFVNKYISLMHCNYIIKFILDRVITILYGGLIGGAVGLILREIRKLIQELL